MYSKEQLICTEVEKKDELLTYRYLCIHVGKKSLATHKRFPVAKKHRFEIHIFIIYTYHSYLNILLIMFWCLALLFTQVGEKI